MNQTLTMHRSAFIGTAIAVLVLVSMAFFYFVKPTESSAPIGLPTSVATVRTVQVGPSANTLLFEGPSTTTPGNFCSSRVITTAGKAIMLKYGTTSNGVLSTNPSSSTEPVLWGYTGHIQAASTTEAYDSGIYGCSFVGAYGFDSTTTITVTEFR